MKLINKRKLFTSLSIVLFSALPVWAEKRIAVLPFEVLSEKSDLKQFGVGTTDTLTTALSTVKDFIMLDRGQIQAVMKENAFQQTAFVDTKSSIKLGSLLGAEILVMGSIQSLGDDYRINSHFTEVKTGKILKSAVVTGKNIFELQDQLSQELISIENVIVSESEKKEISSVTKSTSNMEAYNYFIQGRNEYLLFTREGLEKSIKFYDKALSIDANYSLALSSKAESQALLCYDLFKNDEPYQDIYQEAEKNATKSLELNPDSSIALRAMSVFLISRGDYHEAEKHLKKALEINPNDAESYVWLYEVLEDSKKEKKKEYLDKALTINPYLVPANKKYSDYYFDLGKYDLAKDYLIKVLQVNPLNSFIYYKISNVEKKEKNFEQAIKSLKQAIKITPQYPFLHTSLSQLYINQKKYDEAIKSAKKSIELNSKYIFGYKFLAMSYYYKKDLINAVKYYQEVYNLDPKDLSNNYLLASSYVKLKNYKKAEEYLKKVLEIDSKYPNTHSLLALVYQMQNKNDDAINEYIKELEINQNDLIALYSVGNYYYSKKDYNNASIYLKKLLDLEPNFDNSVYLYLGDTFKELGNKNKSEFYYNNYIAKVEKNLKKNPNDLSNLLGISYLYKEKGNYKQAINYYEKAYKISPSNDISLELADIYIKSKNTNKALEILNKIVLKDNKNAQIYKQIAEIYESKKNLNLAISNYLKYSDLNKEDTSIFEKISILYAKLGKKKESETYYYKFISTSGSNSLTKEKIVSMFYETTDNEKRIFLLKQLIKLEPNNPHFHNNLGALYHQKGLLDNALTEYNEAIKIKPDFDISYENIGMIYEAKGNKLEASKFYKKACELGRSSACGYLSE